MKKEQLREQLEPKRTIKRIVLGDGVVMGDPLPEPLKPTIASIVLDGVELHADGTKTVLQHALPDWVQLLRVGDTVVTNANKERTIKYVVLNGQKIGEE